MELNETSCVNKSNNVTNKSNNSGDGVCSSSISIIPTKNNFKVLEANKNYETGHSFGLDCEKNLIGTFVHDRHQSYKYDTTLHTEDDKTGGCKNNIEKTLSVDFLKTTINVDLYNTILISNLYVMIQNYYYYSIPSADITRTNGNLNNSNRSFAYIGGFKKHLSLQDLTKLTNVQFIPTYSLVASSIPLSTTLMLTSAPSRHEPTVCNEEEMFDFLKQRQYYTAEAPTSTPLCNYNSNISLCMNLHNMNNNDSTRGKMIFIHDRKYNHVAHDYHLINLNGNLQVYVCFKPIYDKKSIIEMSNFIETCCSIICNDKIDPTRLLCHDDMQHPKHANLFSPFFDENQIKVQTLDNIRVSRTLTNDMHHIIFVTADTIKKIMPSNNCIINDHFNPIFINTTNIVNDKYLIKANFKIKFDISNVKCHKNGVIESRLIKCKFLFYPPTNQYYLMRNFDFNAIMNKYLKLYISHKVNLNCHAYSIITSGLNLQQTLLLNNEKFNLYYERLLQITRVDFNTYALLRGRFIIILSKDKVKNVSLLTTLLESSRVPPSSSISYLSDAVQDFNINEINYSTDYQSHRYPTGYELKYKNTTIPLCVNQLIYVPYSSYEFTIDEICNKMTNGDDTSTSNEHNNNCSYIVIQVPVYENFTGVNALENLTLNLRFIDIPFNMVLSYSMWYSLCISSLYVLKKETFFEIPIQYTTQKGESYQTFVNFSILSVFNYDCNKREYFLRTKLNVSEFFDIIFNLIRVYVNKRRTNSGFISTQHKLPLFNLNYLLPLTNDTILTLSKELISPYNKIVKIDDLKYTHAYCSGNVLELLAPTWYRINMNMIYSL